MVVGSERAGGGMIYGVFAERPRERGTHTCSASGQEGNLSGHGLPERKLLNGRTENYAGRDGTENGPGKKLIRRGLRGGGRR